MQKEAKFGQIRILHLEDAEFDRLHVAAMIRESGLSCEIKVVQSEMEFATALKEGVYDLVISDFALPFYNGLKALALAKELCPDVPFVFFSGTIGEEQAIESLKSGAVDYILKQSPNRLIPAIRQALQHAEKRARLREAEEKNREQVELLDKAHDAIMVCDLSNRLTFWNHSAERIYGWSKEEVLGRDAIQLLLKEQTSKFEEARQSLRTQGDWIGEMENVTKDGRTVVVQTRCTLIADDQGRPKSRLILNTDITEQKQLEEQLLRAQRLESLGALVSGIAHDLNNTLSPIVMGVDILRRESHSKTGQDILDMIGSGARRGSEMVKQMLTFARGGSSQKTRLDINPLLREMNKIIADTFPKAVHGNVETDPASWPVMGVPTQLHQVLMNLCVNARDAMPHGGTITLCAKNREVGAVEASRHPGAKEGKYLLVSVADTGSGIAKDQIDKIFKPFFTTKEQGKGTGLGLSTSLTIIKNHGGFMKVESELGRGSVFQCYLPAAVDMEAPANAGEVKRELPVGQGETILVVHHEEGLLAMIRTTLDHYGYQMLSAGDGPQAVALLEQKRDSVRLIISSLSMLFTDDRPMIEVLQQIAPDSKMIAVSSLAQENAQKTVKANAFIQKPFTIENLLTTVHKVLTADASQSSPN
ncbi:MAG TPA: response regulator [Candidatus Methylacidiphilales bacterium]|nr:response regulator [Candidatus Methylacidiphilales bacterium]